ncbi:MAG: glycosyltransferase family 2 protein [Planctomycetes bacterium]|nr:glycosyltransferase family 2 protein [Planctomycetota bacterium]
MTSISAVICCQNAEDTIGPACASVAWADELIVVDSGSTDGTAKIAREHADTFVVEPWRGYSQQKEYAASVATHDWVFVLDADETCTPALAEEIRGLSDADLAARDVYLMKRRNFIFGRHVRAWDPDWQSRLIHRERVTWSGDVLHENRLPSDAGRQQRLDGAIEHKRHSQRGFEDYFLGSRLDARLLMVARDMHDRGRRCSTLDLLFRPWLAFMKFLIVKRGFLDGSFGVLLAQKTAVTTQLKYAALWAIQNDVAERE